MDTAMQPSGKGFYRQMLALALPIALQNLLSTSSNLVDTAMVTRIGNLAVAAAGVAGRWSFFINLIFFGLAAGSAVLISQYWGVKDVRNIQKTFGIGLILGLCASVVYTVVCLLFPRQLAAVYTNDAQVITLAADYLRIVSLGMIPQGYAFFSSIARRATEDVRVPVLGAIVTAGTNIFFNWVLIYGNLGAPALGLRGAAVATAISLYAHMLFYLVVNRRQRHFTSASPRVLLDFDRAYFTRYLKIASPVLINETVWAIGMNLYVMIYARQGSENYAAYTVYASIQDLTFIFFVGICAACGIMVGKAVGQGRPQEAYALGKRFLIMTPLLGLVVGLGLILIRGPVLALMQIETQYTHDLAARLLLFYGFWVGVRNISYTAVVGIIRPGGDTKMGFALDVCTMYFFAIPIVALLAFVFKMEFFWLVIGMYVAEDSLKTVICLYYFKTKRWIRQLTQAGSNALEPPPGSTP